MRFFSLLAGVAFLAACPSAPPVPTSTTAPPTEPTPTAQAVTAAPTMKDDGLPSWTTVGRQYAGAPMTGRGRGGHYQIDVCPDGTYAHLLLDATIGGTWKPGVDGIVLSREGDADQTMTLSADGKDLGGMAYVGPPVCH